ncbi:hypothetical protein CONPUDRAFT_82499 [Coniophora puteana RWD-64-598 SS2]|uniref:Ankyrin n=1 Tax=Coniophora puteana (strain RWD-64-598) TaxID=741705 RepID=A0A5M3MM78_CONPW|nr:uncharacterized protein CONPUDRAFT_82499 [Coniophora puteana RWD-64-598 SS2]EIW80130.1 hypothetical protein CONPUDRAFT_82499 [Coniophora puteana RWD-64-598 SS2]
MVVKDEFLTPDAEDAPPAYDVVAGSRPNEPRDEKHQPQSSSSSSAAGGPSRFAVPPKVKSKPSTSWLSAFPFTTSRTTKHVRQTTLSLVRDLVVDSHAHTSEPPPATAILASCADACASNKLDLSSVLQEPSIEGHTPMYWAIVNGRERELLAALLLHTPSLTPACVADIRLACLAVSNQALFQALRLRAGPFHGLIPWTTFGSHSGADSLILGPLAPDQINIEEVEGESAFVATFSIKLWHKRMRIGGRAGVEFIARGRIWSLMFFATPPTPHLATSQTTGPWQVALSLLEHSPATPVDSRLVIEPFRKPSSKPSTPTSPNPPSSDRKTPPSESDSPAPTSRPSSGLSLQMPTLSVPGSLGGGKGKQKSKALKPVEVRMNTSGDYRLAYRSSSILGTALDTTASALLSGTAGSWRAPAMDYWYDEGACMNAVIQPFAIGESGGLMYEDSPYLAADGTLHARLEARLSKSTDSDCVIC